MSIIKIILFILFIILFLGYLVLNIIFAFKFKKYELDNDGIFLDIMNSLKEKLIYSFELKPNCSSDQEILSLGKWDGLKEGCKCKSYIKGEICTKDEIEDKCEKIKAIKPIEYKKINSNYICVTRSNKTYIGLMKSKQILPKGNKCPYNFKLCGIIDTLENILCVPENEKCPITINDIEPNSNNEGNSTINKKILSTFKLNENITPCINPAEKTWKSNNILEENKNCSTKIFGKLYDERYEKINIINTTKRELYKDNSLLDYYDNNLKLDETIYLYARNFIGFKSESIDKYYYSYKNLILKQKLSNNCGKVLTIFAFSLLVTILFPIISLLNCNLEFFDISEPSQIISWMGLLVIFTIMNFLGDIILSIIIYIRSSDINSKLNIKKSDAYSNKLIQNLIDHHSNNVIFSLIIIILFSGITLICLIFIALKIWKICQKKIKEEKITNKEFNGLDKLKEQNIIDNNNAKCDETNSVDTQTDLNKKIYSENILEEKLKNFNNDISQNNQLNNILPNSKDIPLSEDKINKNFSKSMNVNIDTSIDVNFNNKLNNDKENIYKSYFKNKN